MNTPQNTDRDSVESTALFALSWNEEYDDDDNSIYEAASPYHDDGSPIYFRIRQRLRDNKHEFYEDSDAELMVDEEPRAWPTLDEAKAAMQTDANDIVREYPIGHCAAVRNPANTKARPFEGDLAVIERLLRERGFRLSRGTWAGPEGERLPTVCIDRPDTPEWNGVWSVLDDEHGEVQTAFVLSGVAMETWHRRDVSNAGGEA